MQRAKARRQSEPSSHLSEYGLQELIGAQRTPEGLVDALIDVFDGNPVPALFGVLPWRRDWHPGPACSFRTAVRAHVLGYVMAGVYAFRGVLRLCGCDPAAGHTCDGLGTRLLVFDLDAHRGEEDVQALAVKLLVALDRVGLRPLIVTSRSGKGLHFIVTLDEAVTTREAHAAGVAIRDLAGLTHDRCQVFPSAAHESGLGTFTALPCNPSTREQGGGLVLGDGLRPLLALDAILDELRRAHRERNPSATVRWLAASPGVAACIAPRLQDVPAVTPSAQIVRNPAAHEGMRGGRKPRRRKASDEDIFAAMKTRHPQFRRALATPADAWKGGRSTRDAYLAAFMRRQGMTPEGVVKALEGEATKTAERGAKYGTKLLGYLDATKLASYEPVIPLAGMPHDARSRPPVQMSSSDGYIGTEVAYGDREHPWHGRVPPPERYGPDPNPWWRIRSRLEDPTRRSKALPIVAAFVIDYFFRGPFPRRQFFLSARMISRALGIPERTAGSCVKILREQFADVVKVTPGVAHPVLRLASAFNVLGVESRNPIDWNKPDP